MNFYEILGVARDADEATIKSAFRELAKKYHPDLNPGDAEAEAKMKEVNEAYSTLSDAEKKRQYDAKLNGTDSPFADFLRNVVKHFVRINKLVNLTIEEVIHGCTKELDLEFVTSSSYFAFNSIKKTMVVELPPGCRDGFTVGAQFRDAEVGDAEVTLHFKVSGNYKIDARGNVLVPVPVDYPSLILGGTKDVLLLTGEGKTLKIPVGAQPGNILKVKGEGVPMAPGNEKRGNLLYQLELDANLPTNLSEEALEALKLYKEKLEQVSDKQTI
ncbi:MAG: hypothetical protein E6R04_02155 [Spirochaetes bacterium]|nr:MAG: hypothetical protein E6R04_02155 [Spirochaetota bacterium]